MINSMTAFGRAVSRTEEAEITVEIRSVNNRYLDLTVKLPRTFSFLEDRVKTYLTGRALSRGKVDAYIGIEMLSEVSGGKVTVDTEYARAYIDALRELGETFSLKDDLSLMRVASNKDLFRIERSERDPEKDWEMLLPTLEKAADVFFSVRAAEGERIERDITAKVEGIRALTPQIAALSDEDVKARRDKLSERIRKLLGEEGIVPDESRLLTECALFADKIAIDEEIVRLGSHFEAFYTILGEGEPAGRKLDFLLQEMNRETNTIGSKCSNLAISHTVVRIKSELEKIREQIQNIE